jgi:hypothetical protein
MQKGGMADGSAERRRQRDGGDVMAKPAESNPLERQPKGPEPIQRGRKAGPEVDAGTAMRLLEEAVRKPELGLLYREEASRVIRFDEMTQEARDEYLALRKLGISPGTITDVRKFA